MTERRALLIDDDDHHRNWLALALRDRGWEVIATNRGRPAIDVAAQQQPHVVVTELMLPDVAGMQLARSVRCVIDHDAIVIALTHVPSALQTRARSAGYDYVHGKPADVARLVVRMLAPRLPATWSDPLLGNPPKRARSEC